MEKYGPNKVNELQEVQLGTTFTVLRDRKLLICHKVTSKCQNIIIKYIYVQCKK